VNLQEMNAIVSEDLEHIPKRPSNLPQMMLRLTYPDARKHWLKEAPSKSRDEVLREAIEQVRKDHPDFEPEYDHEYFQL
jgi:hypothetical protein